MARFVQIKDSENLSEEFIKRLRYGLHAIVFTSSSSNINDRARTDSTQAVQSHSIDLNYLTARLENISADGQASSQSFSLATTEDLGDEEYYRQDLKQQTKYYNTLTNEGGRPSHPISLDRDVVKNPGEYREILSF